MSSGARGSRSTSVPVAAPESATGTTLTQPQVQSLAQTQTSAASTIPAAPVPATTTSGASSWVAFWARHPSSLASMSWAWLTRKKNDSPGEMNKMETEYVPAKYFRRFLSDEMIRENPELSAEANKVIQAGRKAYAQSKNLLTSYVMYLSAYKRDGTPTEDEETLRIFTNRVLEDLLLYLVYNYKKSKLKASFLTIPGIPRPTVTEDISSYVNTAAYLSRTPVNFFTTEFIQALNEIIMQNPEKARQYKLVPGRIAGSSSTLPAILDRDTRENAAVGDAIQLANSILEKRAEVYSRFTGAERVSTLELQKRIREGVMASPDSTEGSVLSIFSNRANRSAAAAAAVEAANTAADTAGTAASAGTGLFGFFSSTPAGTSLGKGIKRGRNTNTNQGTNSKRAGITGPDGNLIQTAPPSLPSEEMDEEEEGTDAGAEAEAEDDAQDSQEGREIIALVGASAPSRPVNRNNSQAGGRRRKNRTKKLRCRMNKRKRKTQRR